jgi:ADP-L-glycero-D-manno-heptose 6-epimerase
MIIVTGGAGFIGSALISRLNADGRSDLLVVDRLGSGPKWRNLAKHQFAGIIHKDEFLPWLASEGPRADIEAVVHLGASSSTTVVDADYLTANNLNYSIHLWNFAAEYGVPFLYASSGSTYGDGRQGFSDDPELTPRLRALNPYGFSKGKFDAWALRARRAPPSWAGLRFFNVYGPNEYHKGSQASVIAPFLDQVKSSGTIKLFKSYRPEYADGEQKRDFVYVKDCVNVMAHLLRTAGSFRSGVYNVGTGTARTWLDVGRAVFAAADAGSPRFDFIPMPEPLREHYQYVTEADLSNLREHAGYKEPMTSLEAGVTDYVRQYLLADDRYL